MKGGEWHIVCSKEQRQAKKDKKQQRNEEEITNNESVEQNVASRSFNEYNSSFYATKGELLESTCFYLANIFIKPLIPQLE